ncbi:hypothetical protein KTN05_00695 [Paracoccus sp. Z118]|uniref:hypothetical protein n=1 Tax=Paracoccus sp. Z118 TaxID=2851017 RepID=UPI001C2BAC88|nr:hypothetical protein [Paracoccus sp. Z118]MBV0890369.1 hypothetical protein [Paracoccus sp. Z118]
MIGVILWSNADQKRAVVWCENNGGLAYLESAADFLDAGWPDCGEIVRLSEERAAGFHYARRVTRWDDAQVRRPPPHRSATHAAEAAPADESARWGRAVAAF